MGKKLVLTGTTLTDLDAPRLVDVDAIESAGSLFLLDPTHPVSGWDNGVPTDASTVPNLFADNAALLTSGAAANMHGVVDIVGMSGDQGLVERSGKGGLHGIYSNTDETNTTTNNSCFIKIDFPDAIRQYLVDHYDNNLFFSVWSYTTRLVPTGQPYNAHFVVADAPNPTVSFKFWAAQQGVHPDSISQRESRSDTTGGVTTGPKINNGARADYTGDAPASATAVNLQAYAFQVGNTGYVNILSKSNVPSHILYRVYLEDLTVSGRSYAEVDAIDYALYTAAVLTPGGRYYGDTYTDPATIP